MRAVIAWWDLSASTQTVESMRAYLRDESVEAFSGVRGFRLKLWIADAESARWGVVMLWESAEAAERARPLPSRAAELIGYPADRTMGFRRRGSGRRTLRAGRGALPDRLGVLRARPLRRTGMSEIPVPGPGRVLATRQSAISEAMTGWTSSTSASAWISTV